MRPYRLGLTGSIGMGKSTTAGFFAEAGVPVWDADAAVHRLYAAGGAGRRGARRPRARRRSSDGAVDRDRLRAAVAADPDLLARIEARVHPLVAADRAAFLAANAGADVVLLDIPLLYETGAEAGLDGVLVVSAAARGAARPGAGAARHDRGGASRASSPASCPTPRSAPAPTSSSRPTGALEAARADVLSLLRRIRSERRMREIVLDTETTGLDPDGGDRIVELGAVELVNHMPTGRSFHAYVNPQREVPDEAVRGPRPHRRLPRRQAGLRRGRRRASPPSSATRGWSSTTPPSTSAS